MVEALSAREAAQLSASGSVKLASAMRDIKEAAVAGKLFVRLEQDGLDPEDEDMLRQLGYTVLWSRPMLTYTVSWGGDPHGDYDG